MESDWKGKEGTYKTKDSTTLESNLIFYLPLTNMFSICNRIYMRIEHFSK
jgi:hypothetical protein